MRSIIFIGSVLACLYCLFFAGYVAVVATDVRAVYWLGTLSVVAAIAYGIIAYSRRPWVDPWR